MTFAKHWQLLSLQTLLQDFTVLLQVLRSFPLLMFASYLPPISVHWYSLSLLWFYSPALCSWLQDFRDVLRLIPFHWGGEMLLTTLLIAGAHGLFDPLLNYLSRYTYSLRLQLSSNGFAFRRSWCPHRFCLQASVWDLQDLVASLHSQVQVFMKLMSTNPPSYLAYHWKIYWPPVVPRFRPRDLLARRSSPISN